jgi:hypothetical protein
MLDDVNSTRWRRRRRSNAGHHGSGEFSRGSFQFDFEIHTRDAQYFVKEGNLLFGEFWSKPASGIERPDVVRLKLEYQTGPVCGACEVVDVNHNEFAVSRDVNIQFDRSDDPHALGSGSSEQRCTSKPPGVKDRVRLHDHSRDRG